MLDSEIRDYVARLLNGQMNLREFQEWFVPATWNIDQNPSNDSARELAYSIELLLAEYTNGHLSEQELRSDLERLASNIQMEMGHSQSNLSIKASSSSTTTTLIVSLESRLGEAVFWSLTAPQGTR
jgi:hypothetical protein